MISSLLYNGLLLPFIQLLLLLLLLYYTVLKMLLNEKLIELLFAVLAAYKNDLLLPLLISFFLIFLLHGFDGRPEVFRCSLPIISCLPEAFLIHPHVFLLLYLILLSDCHLHSNISLLDLWK